MTSERLLNMSIEVLYPPKNTNLWLRPWCKTMQVKTVLTIYVIKFVHKMLKTLSGWGDLILRLSVCDHSWCSVLCAEKFR